MTVNRYATQAGKKFESDLQKFFRIENGLDIERLHLNGAEDEGDLLLRLGSGERFIIEAKRTKGFFLADWIRQAQAERANYVKHRIDAFTEGSGVQGFVVPSFVVIHYARGKNISQSYVTTTLEEWLRRL